MRRPLAHWALLLGQVAMWGSAFLLIKIAVGGLGPSSLVAGRLAIASAVLVAVVLLTGRRVPLSRRHIVYYFLLAMTGSGMPFWLISWGEQTVGAGVAGILMAIMPLTTLVLAHFFLDGERMNGAKVAGFALGFTGIIILVGPDTLAGLAGAGATLWAKLALLGAALCYATNAVISRNRPRADPIVAAAGTMVAATIVFVPLALLTEWPPPATPSDEVLASVLVLGIVCTALASVTFFKIIDLAGPTFLSLINYLIPLWALTFSWLLLDEPVEWRTLAALGSILAGIALAETLGRRRG